MNPLRRFDVEGAMVLALGLETLVKYDQSFQIIPSLASDFGSSKDLMTWTYKLNPGVEFSDGTPLTIEDVLYSYQQHLSNPQSAFGFFYNIVKGFRTSGKTDFIIDLKEPSSVFKYTPAHTAGLIWQKSSGEKMGKAIGTPGNLPIGTGPFKFTGYTINDKVSLVRRDGYWGGSKTTISSINVKTISDDSSRLLALRSGSIDGTYDVPPEEFNQWESLSGATTQKIPALGVAFLAFNVTKPPFDDIHVRRAFSYAIDRSGLVKTAIHGAGQAPNGFIPPHFFAALGISETEIMDRYAKFQQYDFDLDRAKAELKQSKYSNGFTISAQYPNDQQRLGDILLNLKQNLQGVGVKINVGEVTEDREYANMYTSRNSGTLVPILYRPDYPDPDDYAEFFASSQIQNSGNNFSLYSNPQVDQLLSAQLHTADNASRVNSIMQVLEIVARDAPIATAWWENSILTTKSTLSAYADPVWYLDNWARTVTPKK